MTKAKRKKKTVTRQSVATRDPEFPTNKRDRRRAHERREDRRDELWPGSAAEVWVRTENDGFSTIPRLLPWFTVLIKHLSDNGDPSSVYVELWARVYDEGYVQVKNETDHAYAAGYSGQRGLRSWRERMRILEDHGFVKTKANGAQQIGHVLLVNPLLVVARLKKQNPGNIPEEWWASFLSRADEVGAIVPKVT